MEDWEGLALGGWKQLSANEEERMSWVASSTDDQSEPSPGPKVVFPTPLRCRCREKLEGATTGAEALNDTGDPTVDDILDSRVQRTSGRKREQQRKTKNNAHETAIS